MAYAMNDRVREQATFAGGTGAVTLPVSAVSGFQTFLAGWGASGTGKYTLVLGSQWETGLGTLNAGGTTLTRTTPKNGSSGVGVAVNFSAGTLDCFGNFPADDLKSIPSFGGDFALINGRINATVGSSALTIAIKTSANTDPTPADPVFVVFRNATLATGDYTVMAITAATSLVVSSGSTLGTANNVAFKLWVIGFNDAGTFRLGVINPTTGDQINPAVLKSSTAEGGAGAADSANTIYTGTAVTSKSFAILAFLDYPSGLGTAGTWSAAPTTTQLFGFGIPRPRFTNIQVFTGSGTYTPTAGMTSCIIECVGGGGGGGGAAGDATKVFIAGGGGSGGYSRALKTAAQIGTSQTVTIGAAGAAGSAGANNGGAGGQTSVGSLCVANGGGGGGAASTATTGGAGTAGTAGTGDVAAAGAPGVAGLYNNVSGSIIFLGGGGGSSALGGGANPIVSVSTGATTGNAASNYGGGGGGAYTNQTASTAAGGPGSAGLVTITEFFT